jgi:pyruvate,orthophosphate dikinase
VAKGLPASPGAASGIAVFDADRAEKMGRGGEKVILVREETKPEDIHGFFASQGILTSRGGKTSHAAVVARGMGKPCVAGAEGIHVDVRMRQAIVGDSVFREGDVITIDGSTGKVYLGEVPTTEAEFTQELVTLLGWADEAARLQVRANADTPTDAARALKYGAMGIGLCRTERMFNAVDRLPIVVEMIVAETLEDRQAALDKLLPIQRGDFREIFKVMAPRPVTVRLLDPPIHEFLPTADQLVDEIEELKHLRDTARGIQVLADTVDFMARGRGGQPQQQVQRGIDPVLVDQVIQKKESMLKKVRALFEVNPMLGHRGVRLGLTSPEIYSMQIRAILEAAAECQRDGVEVHPEIMVPQVCTAQELKAVKQARGRHPPGRGDPLRRQAGLQVRHHDGSGASLHAGREPGRGGRVLLLRHQRPDPGHLLLLPGGRGEQVPAHVQPEPHPPGQPLRGAGREGRGPAHEAGGGLGPQAPDRT